MRLIRNLVKGVFSLVLMGCCVPVWAGSFGSSAMQLASGSAGTRTDDVTVTVSSSDNLKYCAPNATDSATQVNPGAHRGWAAGVVITWPSKVYPSTARLQTSRMSSEMECDVGADTWSNYGVQATTYSSWPNTYLKTTTWWAWVTPEDAYKAKNESAGVFQQEMTLRAWSSAWSTSVDKKSFYIKFNVTDANFKLTDSSGTSWWPAVAVQDGGDVVWGDFSVALGNFNGTTLKLEADVTATADFTLTSGKTLDLNGHTLTIGGGTMTFADGSIVTGSGSIVENGGTGNALPGATFSFEPSALISDTTHYKAEGPNAQGCYTIGYQHVCAWSGSVSGGTLTATCGGTGTCQLGGTATITLSASVTTKTYDGNAVVASLSKSDNFDALQWNVGDIVYKKGAETLAEAPKDVGSYTAEVTVTGDKSYTLTQSFEITQRAISDAEITLSATSFPYTGANQSVTISSVKVGGLDVTYTEDADSCRTAKEIGTHTVKITANGNFTGTLSKDWLITNYSGELSSLAMAESGVGTLSDTTLTVTDSSKFTYDAENQVWYAGLTLTWAVTTKNYELTKYGYAIFTKPELAQMTALDTTFTGAQSGTYAGGKIENATAELSYKKNAGNTKECTYLNTTTWRVAITPAIIEAAKANGASAITGTLYAGALPFSDSDDTQRSDGVAFKNYTITIPIDANLKLYDQYNNQVYPDAGYVAQVGNIKYLTLAAALPQATAESPVTLIGNAEAGTFEIGQNITVNLGGYGNAGAVYKFVNVTDEAKGAKVVSTKAENVSTEVTGFAVQNDNFTYTLYRQHNHLWEATASGAVLTATCTNEETACDIAGRQSAITLTVTGGSDGVSPTFAIDNQADFLSKVNKFGEVATIGEITVTRLTDDGAAYDKWYVGDYTASCIVTVNGEAKTITQNFSIAKGAEYTSGWAVNSRDIRYGSFSEALTAAESGDTIYYRNGAISATSIDYSTDKDITLNFNGATITYQLAEGKGSGADVTLINSGSGKVTFTNVTLKQPYGYEYDWGYDKVSHNFIFQGNFVLAASAVLQVDGDDFKAYSTSGLLEVTSGIHHCQYLENGGKIEISGGNYLYTDHCKPQLLKDGYVVLTKTQEGVGSYYTVVPHEHDFYYVADGNVITIKCQGEGYAGCAWTLTENKLTLTAADAFEGATYALAAYTYDDSFLFEGDAAPQIAYYKDDVKVDTPSAFGNYEARVTVTYNGHTATAVKAFTIKHVHQFSYALSPANTLTATCINEVSPCDIDARTTAIALTVTGGSDGVAPTFAIANEAAFLSNVNRDTTVCSIGAITVTRLTDDGAAYDKWYVGNYRATCVVQVGSEAYTLTNDFAITKSGEYTSGWAVGSRDIRYGSWDEALAAAADGDTIFYRDGDRSFETHEFSIGDKNLTLDFAGAVLTKSAASTMTIKNTGAGVLTLKNVTIKQPRVGLISGQIEAEGNIVFGEGVKVENTATDSGNYCTITVGSGALIVSNGCYQCGFETDGGTVQLEGGKYWENDKPAIGQYNVANHVCREIEGDYKYEVVEHVHNFAYTAAGNVITCDCQGEDAAYCYWHQNQQTATLSAPGATETTEPYAGASVAYTEFWVGDKPTIAYYQGETPLDGAPTRFGDYTAKITVGGATAVAAFTITPMAVTVKVKSAEHASLTVFEGETEISSDTEDYSVTHGSKITAIYVAEASYTPTAVTNVINSAEDGDTIEAPVFTTGPAVIDFGGDPEVAPEIKPVEGKEGVYEIEVKTNTTTAVDISGLGANDVVIVPPQIDAVNGTTESPISPSQVKIVAPATNAQGTVQVDITDAFTITESNNGVEIALNADAVVKVSIAGKDDESIAVKPQLGTAEGTEVAENPFVVQEDKVVAGVKTIPGLTYHLLCGDTPTDIKTIAKTIVAEDTRIVLEAAKDLEKAAKFYKIEVAK